MIFGGIRVAMILAALTTPLALGGHEMSLSSAGNSARPRSVDASSLHAGLDATQLETKLLLDSVAGDSLPVIASSELMSSGKSASNGDFMMQPEIVGVIPGMQELSAPTESSTSVAFSVDMDESSFNYGTFVVRTTLSSQIEGTYSYDNIFHRATFDPFFNLRAGEVVTTVLTSHIQSSEGDTLRSGFGWTFTTAVSSASPGIFERVLQYSAGNGSASVCAADLNEDGHVDMALTNKLSNDVSVLLNNGKGNGTFDSQSAYAVGLGPVSISAGDFDRDGHIDLACANSDSGSSSVSILVNDGLGSFGPSTEYPVNISPVSVCTADFNNDGYADLATADHASGTVSVLLNTGDGTFSSEQIYSVGVLPHSVCAADLNNDGAMDVACANLGGNNVTILVNSGDGSFNVGVDYSAGNGPTDVIAADLDADGDADLALSCSYDDAVSVLMNNGDASFGTNSSYSLTSSSPTAISGGDLDGDGDVDVVTANGVSGDFTVMYNDGNGSLVLGPEYPDAIQPLAISVLDIDGDADLDIVGADFGAARAIILFNSIYYLCGDTDGSYSVDIDDVVYLIAYIFSGGSPPNAIEAGDADCSGSTDIDDVVFLIAYIFSGGNAPCDSDGDEVPDC